MELKNLPQVKSGLYVVESVTLNGDVVSVMRPNPNLSEEEFLSRDPFAEMIEKASEEKEFQKTVLTQKFVNEYLKNSGLETITESRAKNNKRDILGILTTDYKIALQKIVHEYAKNNNINLFANSERKGQILGVLSSGEQMLIDMLVENYAKTLESEEIKSGISR